MSMETTQDKAIVSIAVIPRSVLYCQYIINDGEIHIMKTAALTEWLKSIVPSKHRLIEELMHRFAYILILPEGEEIHELEMDTESERQALKEKMRTDLRSGKILLQNTVILKSRYISSSPSAEDDTTAWRQRFAKMMKTISQAKMN